MRLEIPHLVNRSGRDVETEIILSRWYNLIELLTILTQGGESLVREVQRPEVERMIDEHAQSLKRLDAFAIVKELSRLVCPPGIKWIEYLGE
jgi:hypothetical protein